jgi:hypothetical protein
MKMTHVNIEALSPAAAYVATAASCRQEPLGFLRPDENQALARRCSR